MSVSQTPAASIDAERLRAAAALLFDMGASEVFVFGSAARNELRPESDIDIAVRGLPAARLFAAASKAADVLGQPVDLMDLDDPLRLFATSSAAESWFVSSEPSRKIQVGLEEFATVRQQFESLLSIPPGAGPGVIETSAACAMLHSFYTEIEKILKIIAREWDGALPASESWHRGLRLFRCLR